MRTYSARYLPYRSLCAPAISIPLECCWIHSKGIDILWRNEAAEASGNIFSQFLMNGWN